MSTPLPPTAPPVATTLDNAPESATTGLYRAALGAINLDYYLPLFIRFEVADRGSPGWNWAACLYTMNWMAFRGLWRAAFIYGLSIAGAVLLVLGMGRLVFQFSELLQTALLAMLVVLGFGLPGVYGNSLLHAATRKKMAHALAVSHTMQEACTLLSQQAASKKRFIWLAVVNAMVAGIVAALYLWLGSTATVTPQSTVTSAVGQLAPSASDVKAAPAAAPVISGVSGLTGSSAAAAQTQLPAPLQTTTSALVTTPLAPASAASAVTATAALPPQPAGPPAPSEPVTFVPRRPLAVASAPKEAQATSMAFSSPTIRSSPAPGMAQAEPPVPAKVVPAKVTVKPAKQTNPPATPPTPGKHYVINVGLFANEANARKAHAKLTEAGLTAFTQELDTTKGKRTRVRVGPFATAAQADAAAVKIRALQLDAQVLKP